MNSSGFRGALHPYRSFAAPDAFLRGLTVPQETHPNNNSPAAPDRTAGHNETQKPLTPMVDYGFCFRPVMHRNDCSGFLHLWIDDPQGKTRFIPTSYEVRFYEWDFIEGRLVIPAVIPADTSARIRTLTEYADRMSRDLEALDNIITEFKTKENCKVSNIINRWNHKMEQV